MSDHNSTTSVEFRQIPGFSRFRAGSDGFVYSLYNNQRNLRRVWKRLNGWICPDGYVVVDITNDDSKRVQRRAHVLVCTAFHGPCPDGMECCHGDGNPANNLPGNLRWDTHAENMEDARRHGTWNPVVAIGEAVHNSKMTPDGVREMRRLSAEGMATKALARKFGINDKTAKSIIDRRHWKHVV